MKKTVLIYFFFISFSLLALTVIERLNFNELFQNVTTVYGDEGLDRTQTWLTFLNKQESSSEWNKINRVNHFFNKNISYRTDKQLWGKGDYWANPIETLGLGMGDCEDYAIAKYFSLVALGVPESKLRLMYVHQLQVQEPHMVLTYFEEPNSIPFVLDNFNHKLLLASKRKDLRPVYSFNASGLWLAKAKGLGKKVKNESGIPAWENMLKRIESGELNTLDTLHSANNIAKLSK